MSKSLSITVHPSALSGEYLTVSDAMKHVLDLVGALEGVEAGDESERRIAWALVEAHTHSPPFTVVAEAFSVDPQVSVSIEANRVTKLYAEAVRSLLSGQKPPWLESDAGKLLGRVFRRNLNGVGLTDIRLPNEEPIEVTPTLAQAGLAALERANLETRDDRRRFEYGSAEGQVIGLTKYYNRPALVIQERLSNEKIVGVLSEDLAKRIGPQHAWSEAWEGRFLRVAGELIYGSDGKLKRINVEGLEEIAWADVSLTELRGVDLLQGRTVQEHIDEFWGEVIG